jgi:hypothetical protein
MNTQIEEHVETFTPSSWERGVVKVTPFEDPNGTETVDVEVGGLPSRWPNPEWRTLPSPVQMVGSTSGWDSEGPILALDSYLGMFYEGHMRAEGDWCVSTTPFSSAIPDQIGAMVARVDLPLRWREEGISAPTLQCRQLTREICERIYDKYHLIPARIAASKEEGIYLVFHHMRNGRSFSLEVDNELDCIAQVYDRNSIFVTQPLEAETDLDALMKLFNV